MMVEATKSKIKMVYHLFPAPLRSDPDDGPDIERRGQGKDQTGEQDHRAGPLELAMLPV